MALDDTSDPLLNPNGAFESELTRQLADLDFNVLEVVPTLDGIRHAIAGPVKEIVNAIQATS